MFCCTQFTVELDLETREMPYTPGLLVISDLVTSVKYTNNVFYSCISNRNVSPMHFIFNCHPSRMHQFSSWLILGQESRKSAGGSPDPLVTTLSLCPSVVSAMSAPLPCTRKLHTESVHCTLHMAHCTLHTAHGPLHTAHCTLPMAHCTLYR